MAEAENAPHPEGPKKILEDLLSSARALSANKSVGNILAKFDKIPALEDDIKREVEQGKRHEAVRQQMLQEYNSDRDRWTSQQKALNEQLVEIQQELMQKQTLIKSLESTQGHQAKTIKEVEESAAIQKRDAEQNRRQNQELIKALDLEKTRNRTLAIALDAEKLKLTHNETNLQQLQKAHETLAKKSDNYRQELHHLGELKVPLKSESLNREKVDALWLDLISVVWSWFSRDIKISEDRLSTFRARLETFGQWSRDVPLLSTDTEASKLMRCVAITASVARVFDKYLFQPNYLLPPESGVRDLLARQARIHEEKEASIRASVLAFLPSEQKAAASRCIRTTCDTILELVGDLLAGPEDENDFRSRLEEIAEDACDIWQEIRCLTDAIKPTFDVRHYSNWNWYNLTAKGDHPKIEDLGVFQDSVNDRGMFAILPRLYVFYDDSEGPETHGVLFMRSQTIAAREETDQVTSSPRLERNDSGGGKVARFRRPSTNRRDGQPSVERRSFLEPRGSNGSN